MPSPPVARGASDLNPLYLPSVKLNSINPFDPPHTHTPRTNDRVNP